MIGGVTYSPEMMRRVIKELKSYLDKPNLPWGIDLLLPQVGGNARATNSDYTKCVFSIRMAFLVLASLLRTFRSLVFQGQTWRTR